ncbi:diadenylate cyclase CdaA [soil metagenome]
MELFKISFVSVRLIDVLDILIVSYIFYKLYNIMKGTIAYQIFIALVSIVSISLIAQALNFQTLGWLLSRITEIWVIAFIILFQPEIRRLLLIIGNTRWTKVFNRSNVEENVNEVSDAVIEMQRRGWGALFVITKTTGLQNVVETGEKLNALINKELLLSIFNPKSPLHDGAVILNKNFIEAARCTLPLSNTKQQGSKKFGTRHRAGIGITEESDAISIILSEENGMISIAQNGLLTEVKDNSKIVAAVKYCMGNTSVKDSVKVIFEDAAKSLRNK